MMVIESPSLGLDNANGYFESPTGFFIHEPQCHRKMLATGQAFSSYLARGGVYTHYVMAIRLDKVFLIYVALIYSYEVPITSIIVWCSYQSAL